MNTAIVTQPQKQMFAAVEEKRPKEMTDAELAERVRSGFQSVCREAAALQPYYDELRNRFARKPRGERLAGCRTWDEYCETVIGKTRRAVNYFIAGGNPRAMRKGKPSTRVLRAGTDVPIPTVVDRTHGVEVPVPPTPVTERRFAPASVPSDATRANTVRAIEHLSTLKTEVSQAITDVKDVPSGKPVSRSPSTDTPPRRTIAILIRGKLNGPLLHRRLAHQGALMFAKEFLPELTKTIKLHDEFGNPVTFAVEGESSVIVKIH